jgi:hypothetical protein
MNILIKNISNSVIQMCNATIPPGKTYIIGPSITTPMKKQMTSLLSAKKIDVIDISDPLTLLDKQIISVQSFCEIVGIDFDETMQEMKKEAMKEIEKHPEYAKDVAVDMWDDFADFTEEQWKDFDKGYSASSFGGGFSGAFAVSGCLGSEDEKPKPKPKPKREPKEKTPKPPEPEKDRWDYVE